MFLSLFLSLSLSLSLSLMGKLRATAKFKIIRKTKNLIFCNETSEEGTHKKSKNERLLQSLNMTNLFH